MGHVLPVPAAVPNSARVPLAHLTDHRSVAGNATIADQIAAPPTAIEHYRGLRAYDLIRHSADVIRHRKAIIYGDQNWTYEQLNFDIV